MSLNQHTRFHCSLWLCWLSHLLDLLWFLSIWLVPIKYCTKLPKNKNKILYQKIKIKKTSFSRLPNLLLSYQPWRKSPSLFLYNICFWGVQSNIYSNGWYFPVIHFWTSRFWQWTVWLSCSTTVYGIKTVMELISLPKQRAEFWIPIYSANT